MSDAEKLTIALVKAGATRDKVIEIIDGYGDAIDWSGWTLENIIGEVWNSDANSGDEHRHRTFTNQQCTRARPRDPARPGCEHTGCVSDISEPGHQRLECIQ